MKKIFRRFITGLLCFAMLLPCLEGSFVIEAKAAAAADGHDTRTDVLGYSYDSVTISLSNALSSLSYNHELTDPVKMISPDWERQSYLTYEGYWKSSSHPETVTCGKCGKAYYLRYDLEDKGGCYCRGVEVDPYYLKVGSAYFQNYSFTDNTIQVATGTVAKEVKDYPNGASIEFNTNGDIRSCGHFVPSETAYCQKSGYARTRTFNFLNWETVLLPAIPKYIFRY